MKRILLLAFALLTATLAIPASAQVPQLLNYQARVAVGTLNFDGSGQFKFALVDTTGATTYWSNDGTSTAGSQPTAAVTLTVTKGLYSVLLGDTALTNMTAIPVSVWTNADVRLRVWFNDGTNGFQLLTPDQRLAPNGYLPTGSVTSAKIATGAVGNAQLAANAVQAANLAAGSVGSTQLAAGAVGSTQLAANAVQTSNIATGAVTNAQLAAGSVTGGNFATQSRSGTALDGVLDFTTPGSVSVPLAFSPSLNAKPALAPVAGWTFSGISTAGFTATAAFTPRSVISSGAVTASAATALAQTASGRPAIPYHDTTVGKVRYAVSPTADGSGTWTTVDIGNSQSSGNLARISLVIIGGVPCIGYRNNADLTLARSSNADGTGTWTNITVPGGGLGNHASLAIVNGKPALCGANGGSSLRYAINSAADGSGTWTVVTVDSATGAGFYGSMAVVNGNPAISYHDNANGLLKYVRATDATGATWGTPLTVDTDGSSGGWTSLQVVNGNPAISYYDSVNGVVKYVRATDASGTAWGAPAAIDSAGSYTSMFIVDGRPAISYYKIASGDLGLAYASAVDGSGTWKTVSVDTGGNVGRSTSLAVVNGGPAISYYDITNSTLKYAGIPDLNWSASEFGVAGPIAATSFSGDGSALTGLNGANLASGTVGSAQLAAGAVQTSNIAAGAVTSADIASGTVVPAQTVSATAQAATANTSYAATGSSLSTFTLPTTANVGDVVNVIGTGTGGWNVTAPWIARDSSRQWLALASSADGNKLLAGVLNGQLYTSTNSGVTWTPRASAGSHKWQSLASSADGSKLVALDYGGVIYTSTDSGANWTPREALRNWNAVASSIDGSKLVAAEAGGRIYTSTDSGVNWTPRATNSGWVSLASSADGSKLVAAVSNGQLYTSTDSGVSWTARESSRFWNSVASSADGNKLVATVFGSQIYTSTDSGVSWTVRESNRAWKSVASSADGNNLVAAVEADQIYVSTDSGVSWTPQESNREWQSVASSADGSKLVATEYNGQIYTSDGNISGAQRATATLQYLGNGQWGTVGDTSKVSKSGETMTGPLALPTNGLTVGASQLVASGGNIGIGTKTPTTPLTVQGDGHGIRQTSSNGLVSVETYVDASGGWLGTFTNHPLYFYTNNGSAQMTLSQAGKVGIGTNTPSAPLEVSGATSQTIGPGKYFDSSTADISSFSSGPVPISIKVSNNILATGFDAVSDERIKVIQGRSDGATDLGKLLRIEITDYRFKDAIGKGSRPQKKVIAQQVETVYPQAVSQATEVVPDIYRQAVVKDGWVQLATDLKVGERVKLIGEKEQGVHEVLEVRKDAFRTAFQPATDKVFVYGREVKDFRSVDYEAIAMLNVSATQELARENAALKQRVAALEARDKEREARLARLESLLPAAAAPVALKTAEVSNQKSVISGQ